MLGTYRPGVFIFQCPIFLPLHIVHGVSKARILKGMPFPSPVDHILSDLSTMTLPSWVAPQAWLGFTELDKAVMHVTNLDSFCDCGLHSFFLMMDEDKWLVVVS